MKPTLGIGLLLMAACAWAQEGPPKNTQAFIEVKYADVNRLANLLQPMFNASTMIVRADTSLHVIAVSGPADMVAALRAAIEKLDVAVPPEPDVELAVYLISGMAQGQGADEVPQELASTVKQLHGMFAYKSYKLSDTLVVRGRAIPRGERPFNNRDTETEGVLPSTTVNLRYHLTFNSLNVSSGTPRTVHINGLRFNLQGPRVTSTTKENVTTELTQTPANILTDLDVREGQKTVVGKSSVNSAGDALILVIVPKVVE
jgi:hypothetical protein